jgi:hypothetical protein
MLTKFWDKIAENLAQESKALFLAPAFAFWAGGLGLYALKIGWQPILEQISAWNTAQSIASLLALAALLTISTALMNQFTISLLRFLEGYWRWPLAGIAQRRIESIRHKLNQKEERWNLLARQRAGDGLTALQAREYAQLDAELANYPVDDNWKMPTRLGNLLRAAEEYPGNHYGLEINITWPRLWLLIPENVQKEVARSRQNLDQAVQVFGWAILFWGWGFLNPWAFLAAILLTAGFYPSIIQTAGAYSELLKSAYDLYRFRLYEAVYWPKPDSPAAEIQAGQTLTKYLHRAESGQGIKFEFKNKDDKPAPKTP